MFKIGMIGLGRISPKHIESIEALGQEKFILSAVCEIDKTVLDNFCHPVNKYLSIEDMLANEKLDLAVVCTPSGEHFKHASLCIQYKVNVLVEKPIVLKLSEAKKLSELARNNNVRAWVVKQNRYNAAIQTVRRALDNGAFGTLVSASTRVRWHRDQNYYNQAPWRGTWKQDGGILANQAIHHIDLIRWLCGKPKKVFAKAKTVGVNIEAENTACAIVEFSNGCIATIEATGATSPKDIEGSISLLGLSGTAVVGGFAANKIEIWDFVPESKKLLHDLGIEIDAEDPESVYGFGHKKLYYDLFIEMSTNSPLLVDIEAAFDTLLLLHAIYRSIEDGCEITIEPENWKFIESRRLGNV